MGFKRRLFHDKKHMLHFDKEKLARMDAIYDTVLAQRHGAECAGRYADLEKIKTGGEKQ